MHGSWSRLRTILVLGAIVQSSGLMAQTPWEAAPASPARYNETKIESLPPPPVSSKSESTDIEDEPLFESISIPPHVPIPKALTAPQGKAALRSSGAGSALDLPLPNGATVQNPLQPMVRSQSGSFQMPQFPAFPSQISSQLNAPANANSANKVAAANGAGSAVNMPLPQGLQTSGSPALGSPASGTAATQVSQRTMATSFRPAVQSSPAGSTTLPLHSTSSSNLLVSRGPVATDAQVKKFDDGTLIAVVGSDRILAGDLARYVEPAISDYQDRIQNAEQEKMLREQILRQVLVHYIEIKAMYQEFFRDATAGSTPDKAIEMKKKVTTQAGKIFFEKQVENMKKQYGVERLEELEAKLREKSMSLRTMKTSFVEQVLAQELERKYIPNEYEVDRNDLVKYYQEHQQEWSEPAMAKWRQLTVRFDEHDYDRSVVEAKIKQLGNEVYLGGKSFEAVAKQSSEGYTADQGGVYDWTRKGSLKSKPIDEALFSIPLGRMSEVIEDDIGMHIVVVDQRKESRTKPFTEAQPEIRKILSDQRREKEVKEFRNKVLNRTPVWTLWPEDLKGKVKNARPLSEAIGAAEF